MFSSFVTAKLVTMKKGMIIICVDGAVPYFVRMFKLFVYSKSPGFLKRPSALKSVYPSSTAPAHASMMTGAFPESHGIVANRFWENASSNFVSLSRGDPIATIHPYEHVSLTMPSVLSTMLARDLNVAAVQFPHTFSRSWWVDSLKSVYCVYHPSESKAIVRIGDRWIVAFREMGCNIEIALEHLGQASSKIDYSDWRVTPITSGTRVEIKSDWIDVLSYQNSNAVSFSLFIRNLNGSTLSVYRSTAVVAMCCGSLTAEDVVRSECLPHSPRIDYTVNRNHEFHESPGVSWITGTALKLLESDPDVLFVRYPQVDHAQEFLYWLATRGTAAERRESMEQVETVYQQVHEGIQAILSAAGWSTPSFIFSDHGITQVDRHVHLNQLLREADMDKEFVFQGDSTCAYLYGDRPVLDREVERLRQIFEAYPVGARIAGWDELRNLRAFHSARCGQLSVLCEAHTEFQYGPGEAVANVRSASHGCSPDLPSMDGVWVPLAGNQILKASPKCLTDLAPLILESCAGN